MFRFFLTSGLFVATAFAVRAQQRVIPAPLNLPTPPTPIAVPLTGRVVEAATQQPIPGATILFPDLRQGAAADADGRFSFTRLPRGRFLLQVRAVGFATVVRVVETADGVPLTIGLTAAETEIGQVVVTGVSASTEMRRSSVPTAAIDREQLNRLAPTNAIDALSRVSGVAQLSTGPAISKPVIRGLGYNRIVTLNNGSKQEGQQWGDEHGIELDENSFERVEIIKGPGSLLYGSDAMAGVLNFLPPDPLAEGRIVGSVSTSYQTNNRQQAYSLMNAGNLNGLTWLARGSAKVAGDYRNRYDGRVFNSAFREFDGNGYVGLNRAWGFAHLVVSSFNQQVGLTEGDRDSVSGRFVREAMGADGVPITRPVTDAELRGYALYPPYQRINHQRIGLDNNFILGRSRLTVQVNYQQNRRREFGDVSAPDDPQLYFRLRTADYAVRYFLPESNGFQTTVGTSGMRQWNANLGPEFLVPAYRLLDGGVFGLVKKTFGRLDLSGGVRYDVRRITAEALSLGPEGQPVAPGTPDAETKFSGFVSTFRNVSGSLGGALNLTDQLTLKANVSRGFRAPNIAELGSNGQHEGTLRYEIGNPAQRAETSLQLDAGVSFTSDHISLTVDAFRNEIQHFIFPRRLANAVGSADSLSVEGIPVFKYGQGHAVLHGGEVSLDLHPHPFDWLHFENSFAMVRAEQTDAPAPDQRWLPFTPADRFQSELRGQFRTLGAHVANLYVRAAVEHTFRQERVFSAFGTETPTPAYTLVNAGLGADFVNRHRRTVCSAFLTANNLFDVGYQSGLSRLKYAALNPATGRTGVYNMGRNVSLKLVFPLVLAGG
jgi:iron complex outermembrane recepter protein